MAAVVAVLIAAAAFAFSPAGGPLREEILGGSSDDRLTAAIIDQLSLTAANPGFAEAATSLLEQAGYRVDYYSGEQATVELYRTLPQRGYDLVVLRVHSTAVIERGDEAVDTVSLFTNEPYSQDKYYEEQLAGRLGFASYSENSEKYFGITAEFVASSMKGEFDDALIIMMGCDGLKTDRAAEAFLGRGASAYVSWSDFVSAPHTDTATEHLLRYLLVDRLSAADAVERTNDEVGPDPAFGSRLLLRPLQ